MNKTNKVLILISGILLILSISIGLSYAYYVFSNSQEGLNIAGSDCFKITFEEENDISLMSALPMKESNALGLRPYSLTINNICNNSMDYYVNLETLNGSTMDLNAVRYKLNNSDSKILGSLTENDPSVYINDNVMSSKTIGTGSVRANKSKKINLIMWIDEDARSNQVEEKEFYSKVTINVFNRKEVASTLIPGPDFISAIKELVGIDMDINTLGWGTNYFYYLEEVSDKLNEYDEIKENDYSNFDENKKITFDHNYDLIKDYYEYLQNLNINLEMYDNKIKKIVFTNSMSNTEINKIKVSTDDPVNEIFS